MASSLIRKIVCKPFCKLTISSRILIEKAVWKLNIPILQIVSILTLGIAYSWKLSRDGALIRSFIVISLLFTTSLLWLFSLKDNNFLKVLAIAIFCAYAALMTRMLLQRRLKTGPKRPPDWLTNGFAPHQRLTNAYQVSCTDRHINGFDTIGEQDRKKQTDIKTSLNRSSERKRELSEI